MTEKLHNGWTAKEVADLAACAPEYVNRLPDGTLVANVTKGELRQLSERFPSMRILDGRPSRQAMADAAAEDPASEAVLRARYPTMFKR